MIGQQIKTIRRKKKITRVELAKLTGVSVDTIGSIESGRREPSYPLILKIAEVLNCEYEQILKPK